MTKKTLVPSKIQNGYVVADVGRMEALALEKANKAISAIENAVAVWEASAEKPKDLSERMSQLKNFYEALTDWEKKALKTAGKEDMVEERVERLKEFAKICYAYA